MISIVFLVYTTIGIGLLVSRWEDVIYSLDEGMEEGIKENGHNYLAIFGKRRPKWLKPLSYTITIAFTVLAWPWVFWE